MQQRHLCLLLSLACVLGVGCDKAAKNDTLGASMAEDPVTAATVPGPGSAAVLAQPTPVPADAGGGPSPALFVDSRSCARCHEDEYRRWTGSHHDLAMQPATGDTVLGDFDDASFIQFGKVSRFFKRGSSFFVNTEGPDGKLADFEVKYTFGVEWLQQYLLEFGDGRLQSLTIAWDTENHRWFSLYPDEPVVPDDPLHWTGLYQNWNMMCAECHSTDLQKNYDPSADSYDTSWAEIDVGCQACHGPASRHLSWAQAREREMSVETSSGVTGASGVDGSIAEPVKTGVEAAGRVAEPAEAGTEAAGCVAEPAEAGTEAASCIAEPAEAGMEAAGCVAEPAEARGTTVSVDAEVGGTRGEDANRVSTVSGPYAWREDKLKGFTFELGETEAASWVLDPGTLKYKRSMELKSQVQLNTCAPCHSRRHPIDDSFSAGQPLLQTQVPELLLEPLYFADGQIRDEVYVYGSFLQSKMYAKGVRCSDCHEPHSLELRYPGDNVCLTCHLGSLYESSQHHFHKSGSAGASCVECHMPARYYMRLDPRRDHSIRIPRPDLGAKLGVPDACSRCHHDKPVEWSVDAARKWWGSRDGQAPNYGEILAAGRSGGPQALGPLLSLAADREQPAIVRATALELLRSYGDAGVEAMIAGSRDEEPLLRLAAVRGLEVLPPQKKIELLSPLLGDPLRAVRIEAARVLAPLASMLPAAVQHAAFDTAIAEFEAAQRLMADTPAAHFNMAVLSEIRGDGAAAKAAYRWALKLDPSFLPARFNLANFYNRSGRNLEAERVLREGLRWAPDEGELRYSLGLLLAEEGKLEEAARNLAEAARLLPQRPRVLLNFGLTLQHLGRSGQAETQLLAAHALDDSDPGIVNALAVLYLQRADLTHALYYTRKLVALVPEDPGPRGLLARLEAQLAAAR